MATFHYFFLVMYTTSFLQCIVSVTHNSHASMLPYYIIIIMLQLCETSVNLHNHANFSMQNYPLALYMVSMKFLFHSCTNDCYLDDNNHTLVVYYINDLAGISILCNTPICTAHGHDFWIHWL